MLLEPQMIIIFFIILILLLMAYWVSIYGLLRGVLASIFRSLWVAPFLVFLFPKQHIEENLQVYNPKIIRILLDDSISLKVGQNDKGFLEKVAIERVESIQKKCQKLGCVVRVDRLSDLSEDVLKGYSPLNNILESWLSSIGRDPWIFISDGGDEYPRLHWHDGLKNVAIDTNSKVERGFIIKLLPRPEKNLWLEKVDSPAFAFDSKPVEIGAIIKRSIVDSMDTVQVQALSGGKVLAVSNAVFQKGESSAHVFLNFSAMSKGKHYIKIKTLPLPDEKFTWDNELSKTIEVLPNTLGVLHILGNPSWDGRYLRRYLKSEPKYDLISFFILRDPWDFNRVNEREMSLIPFPVKRLFTEELPNFKLVIIQNFKLLQFLDKKYQKNLVEFVKNGGGLLYIGGKRALQTDDILNSPLKEILPFDLLGDIKSAGALQRNNMMGRGKGKIGAWYDPDLEFSIKLANPNLEKELFVDFYKEWKEMESSLVNVGPLKGMHHTENLKFKDELITPLLQAQSGNMNLPLAVASYPEKGRAIWIFTDQMWKLASTMKSNVESYAYQKLMNSSISWLMRKESRKPLNIQVFNMRRRQEGKIRWKAVLVGSSLKYFLSKKDWKVSVCNVTQDNYQYQANSSESVTIWGDLEEAALRDYACTLKVKVGHEAFGDLEEIAFTDVAKRYKDSEVGYSDMKMTRLIQLTGAKSNINDFDNWLAAHVEKQNVIKSKSTKTKLSHYWLLDTWYIILVFVSMLGEVIVRRWDEIFT